jgi:sortase (surface protein transpeptidase)
VFARLATVRKGARIRVDRADGTTVTFRVTSVSRVPKTRFPTDLVYAPTLDPSLRLVTCGGGFDRTRESYRDNVIAFAEPI